MKDKFYKTSKEEMKGTLMCRSLFGGDYLEVVTMGYRKMIFKLALKIARQDKRKELFDDLVQTGFLALYDALTKYKDIKNGAKLSTYIYIYIEGMMMTIKGSEVSSTISLDSPINENDSGSGSVYEYIPDTKKDPLSEAITREVLHACGKLPESLSRVIQLRYVEGKTFEEVGEVFDFSRQRAEQIEKKALRKLRRALGLTEAKNAA